MKGKFLKIFFCGLLIFIVAVLICGGIAQKTVAPFLFLLCAIVSAVCGIFFGMLIRKIFGAERIESANTIVVVGGLWLGIIVCMFEDYNKPGIPYIWCVGMCLMAFFLAAPIGISLNASDD